MSYEREFSGLSNDVSHVKIGQHSSLFFMHSFSREYDLNERRSGLSILLVEASKPLLRDSLVARLSVERNSKFIKTRESSSHNLFLVMAEPKLVTAFLKGKVSALIDEGQSERQISWKVGVPKTTVHRWKANCFSLSRKDGSGRKRKTDRRADRLIIRLVRNDPSLSSTELRNSLQDATVSALTVRRRLQEGNFKSRKRLSGIELTASHKHHRLEWAMKHCHWRSEWSRVVWSDEASVCLRGRDGRLRIWMQSGDKVPDHLVLPVNQGGGRLLIWAAIWVDGQTELHIQRKNMNSDGYVEVLRRYILPLSNQLGDPSSDWIYMDDNATCHRSSVTNAFKDQAGIRTLKWPARSPDLNPIENAWSLLKRGVRRSIHPGDDLLRLEALLKEEWERLSQGVIKRMIESLPSRIRQVIELSGDVTKY